MQSVNEQKSPQRTRQKISSFELSLDAMMLAFLVIGSQIIVPTPIGVPFTLQVLAVALVAYSLDMKNALLVVSSYLLLGFLGLPFFSGFTGGPAKLLAPSGGYLLGFIPMLILLNLARDYFKGKKPTAILFSVLGLAACHLIGIGWLSYVTNIALFQAFMLGSLPFLLKDIVCLLLAAYLSLKLRSLFVKSL